MPTHPRIKLDPPHKFITLPNNFSTNIIINNLNKLDIKTAKTTRDLVHTSLQQNIVSGVVVYCIPCKNCKLKYNGETSWNFHVCLKEHKRDIRIGHVNNALVQHISLSNPNFEFNSAKMLIYIHKKR